MSGFAISKEPNLTGANDDISAAEQALRDQYCGHLDVKKDAPERKETIIVDANAFEHAANVAAEAAHEQHNSAAPAAAEPQLVSKTSDTPRFRLEGVTLDEAAKLMEKHKGSRLMLLLPEGESLAEAN